MSDNPRLMENDITMTIHRGTPEWDAEIRDIVDTCERDPSYEGRVVEPLAGMFWPTVKADIETERRRRGPSIELTDEDRANVHATCGRCGSGDVMFVACPEHEWAVAFTCFSCTVTEPIGRGACKECGWEGRELDYRHPDYDDPDAR